MPRTGGGGKRKPAKKQTLTPGGPRMSASVRTAARNRRNARLLQAAQRRNNIGNTGGIRPASSGPNLGGGGDNPFLHSNPVDQLFYGFGMAIRKATNRR